MDRNMERACPDAVRGERWFPCWILPQSPKRDTGCATEVLLLDVAYPAGYVAYSCLNEKNRACSLCFAVILNADLWRLALKAIPQPNITAAAVWHCHSVKTQKKGRKGRGVRTVTG